MIDKKETAATGIITNTQAINNPIKLSSSCARPGEGYLTHSNNMVKSYIPNAILGSKKRSTN